MTDPHPEPWDNERAAAFLRTLLADHLDSSLGEEWFAEAVVKMEFHNLASRLHSEDTDHLIKACVDEAIALIRHMGNPIRPSPIRQLTLAVRCSAQCLVRDCLPPLLHQHPEVQKRLIGIGDTTREIEAAEVRLIDRLTPTEQNAKEPSP